MTELTTELKRAIYDRQSGMCAVTGKKFEDFNNSMDVEFLLINPAKGTNDIDNIVMIWNHSEINKNKLRKYLFPYANFTNYTIDSKVAEIKAEIDEVVLSAPNSTDIRATINQINELAGTVQILGLAPSQRNEYRRMLLDALAPVKEKQNAEREKNQSEWYENYDAIKPKIDAAVEFAKEATFFKEAREKLAEVQKELRDINLSPDSRNELNKIINNAFANLNEKHREWFENYEMECIDNFYNLQNILDDTLQKVFSVESFPEAKDLLIEMQNKIKDKVLKRNQKDELFTTIRNTFDELREKFTEYKRITAEEAAENFALIKPKVDEAIEFAKKATTDIVNDAREKLIECQKALKEIRLQREQKDNLFDAIRAVFTDINEKSEEERKHFDEESNKIYDNLMARLEVIIVDIENSLDLNGSSEALITISSEIQLSNLRRKHRGKLYDRLHEAFDLLTTKRSEYNKRRFSERRKRLTETQTSFKQRLERTSKLIEKDKEILASQQQKLNEITDSNAPNKARLEQVVSEITKRISEREGMIEQVTNRIANIDKELEKINKQEESINKRAEKDRNKNRKKETTNEIIVPENIELTETTENIEITE